MTARHDPLPAPRVGARTAGLLLLLAAGPAGAQTSGPSPVPRLPFETVARGVRPGETRLIPPGLYECKEFTFGPAGPDLEHPTTFRFAPSGAGRAVITGPGGTLPRILFSNFVRIEGLWFGGKAEGKDGNIVAFGREGVQIVGCTFFGKNFSLLAGNTAKNVLIRDCRLIGMGAGWLGHPIYFSGGPPPTSQDLFCIGNIIVGGDGFAIHGWHDPKRLTIVGNFTAAGMCGMVAQGHGHSVHHNVFWKPRGRDDAGNVRPDWDWCALVPTELEGGNGDPKGPMKLLRFDHNLCWSDHPIRDEGQSIADPVENYTKPGRAGTQMKLKAVPGHQIPLAVPWMPHVEAEIDAAVEGIQDYFRTKSPEEMVRDPGDKLEKAFAVLKVRYAPAREDLGPFWSEAEEKTRRHTTPVPAANGEERRQATRKTVAPGAVAAWDARLLARLREELRAGRKPSFQWTATGEWTEVVECTPREELHLQGPAGGATLAWSALSLADRRNLALALVRKENAADHALAAFYLLALGENERARSYLAKAGGLADEVRAVFGAEAPAAPRENGDAPVPGRPADATGKRLFWTTGAASGRTYFVDGRAAAGGNGSPASPWRSITEASQHITAGDTVIIRGGVYEVPKYKLEFRYRGSAMGPDGRPRITTFKAAPGERVIITGLDGHPPYALIGGAPYLRIEGIWFGGPVWELIRGVGPNTRTADGRPLAKEEVEKYLQGGFCADSDFMQVVGCTFFGLSGTMARGRKMLIQDCRYVNVGGGFHHHPIYLGGYSHLIADRNLFVGGEGYGLHGWHNVKAFVATRNLLLSGGYGFVADGEGHLVANNFFWKMRGSPDGGGRKIGAWLPGRKITFLNNVLGPDALILDSDPSNRIASNVFIDVKAWGEPKILLGRSEAGSRFAEAEIDALVAHLEQAFRNPLDRLIKDDTIEPAFAKLRKLAESSSASLGRGEAWFETSRPFPLGPGGPVPETLEEFWQSVVKLGIPDWEARRPP